MSKFKYYEYKIVKHKHICIPFTIYSLVPSAKQDEDLFRIKCKKSFNVQGIRIIADNTTSSNLYDNIDSMESFGGRVQNIQSIDDTSWICKNVVVYSNVFIENESYIDGCAEISGYTTLSHVRISGTTTIKHSYIHNCSLQGSSNIELSEINPPVNDKESKVEVKFLDDTNFSNVIIEFVNVPKLKTVPVTINAIGTIKNVSFTLPYAKHYVIIGEYAIDLSDQIIPEKILDKLEKLGKNKSQISDYDVSDILRLCENLCKARIIQGRIKLSLKTGIIKVSVDHKGYDWLGTRIAASIIEEQNQELIGAQNVDVGIENKNEANFENTATEQKKCVINKKENDYNKKLDELKKEARELGIEI